MPSFGYWGMKGIAQPIRIMCHAQKVDITQDTYTEKEKWENQVKPKLGLEFPNLPYYIDGDLKLTQSGAIPRYIAEKGGFLDKYFGKDIKERAQINMLLGVFGDLNTTIRKYFFMSEKPKPQDFFKSSVQKPLQSFMKFIKGKFMMGDNITYVDLQLFTNLQYIELGFKDCINNVKGICEYKQRVSCCQCVKNYYASDKAITLLMPPS